MAQPRPELLRSRVLNDLRELNPEMGNLSDDDLWQVLIQQQPNLEGMVYDDRPESQAWTPVGQGSPVSPPIPTPSRPQLDPQRLQELTSEHYRQGPFGGGLDPQLPIISSEDDTLLQTADPEQIAETLNSMGPELAKTEDAQEAARVLQAMMGVGGFAKGFGSKVLEMGLHGGDALRKLLGASEEYRPLQQRRAMIEQNPEMAASDPLYGTNSWGIAGVHFPFDWEHPLTATLIRFPYSDAKVGQFEEGQIIPQTPEQWGRGAATMSAYMRNPVKALKGLPGTKAVTAGVGKVQQTVGPGSKLAERLGYGDPYSAGVIEKTLRRMWPLAYGAADMTAREALVSGTDKDTLKFAALMGAAAHPMGKVFSTLGKGIFTAFPERLMTRAIKVMAEDLKKSVFEKNALMAAARRAKDAGKGIDETAGGRRITGGKLLGQDKHSMFSIQLIRKAIIEGVRGSRAQMARYVRTKIDDDIEKNLIWRIIRGKQKGVNLSVPPAAAPGAAYQKVGPDKNTVLQLLDDLATDMDAIVYPEARMVNGKMTDKYLTPIAAQMKQLIRDIQEGVLRTRLQPGQKLKPNQSIFRSPEDGIEYVLTKTKKGLGGAPKGPYMHPYHVMEAKRFLDFARNSAAVRPGSRLEGMRDQVTHAADYLRHHLHNLDDPAVSKLLDDEAAMLGIWDSFFPEWTAQVNTKILGPFDYMMGAGGLASGHALAGVSAMGLMRGFQQPIFTTSLAVGLDRLGKGAIRREGPRKLLRPSTWFNPKGARDPGMAGRPLIDPTTGEAVRRMTSPFQIPAGAALRATRAPFTMVGGEQQQRGSLDDTEWVDQQLRKQRSTGRSDLTEEQMNELNRRSRERMNQPQGGQ